MKHTISIAEQYRALSLLREQYCSAVALAKDIDYWAVDPKDLDSNPTLSLRTGLLKVRYSKEASGLTIIYGSKML